MTQKSITTLVVVVGVLAVAGIAMSHYYSEKNEYASDYRMMDDNDRMMGDNDNAMMGDENEMMGESGMKDPLTRSINHSDVISEGTMVNGVREFSMDSYYDPAKNWAVFTLAQMVVKKGEPVRVKVHNTFGKHDFTIDEFNVHTVTPQDETTAIEFTPDKAGDFVFYCSMPTHRSKGQWGLLRVMEQ